jgi:hypothetical protein
MALLRSLVQGYSQVMPMPNLSALTLSAIRVKDCPFPLAGEGWEGGRGKDELRKARLATPPRLPSPVEGEGVYPYRLSDRLPHRRSKPYPGLGDRSRQGSLAYPRC